MYIVFVIWVSKRRYKFFVIWFSPRVSIMHGQRVNLIAYVDVWVKSMPCMGECIVECEGTRAMSRHPTLHDPTDIPLSKSDPIGQSGLATPRGSGCMEPILPLEFSPTHFGCKFSQTQLYLALYALFVGFVRNTSVGPDWPIPSTRKVSHGSRSGKYIPIVAYPCGFFYWVLHWLL